MALGGLRMSEGAVHGMHGSMDAACDEVLFHPHLRAAPVPVLKCGLGAHSPDKHPSLLWLHIAKVRGPVFLHHDPFMYRPVDQSPFPECAMLFFLLLCLCPCCSFGLEGLSPFPCWDNAYLSFKSLLNLPLLSEAFPELLGRAPLPHGSSPKFLAHSWSHVLSLPLDTVISLTRRRAPYVPVTPCPEQVFSECWL